MTEGKSRSYFDYRLRLQVPPDSADRLLLEYLKGSQHFTYSEKEMVLAALRMCWLPIAFQHGAGLSQGDLKRVGLDAIMRLKEQIRYVAAVTGVDQAMVFDRASPYVLGGASLYEPAIESESGGERSMPPNPIRFSAPVSVAHSVEDGYERDLFDD